MNTPPTKSTPAEHRDAAPRGLHVLGDVRGPARTIGSGRFALTFELDDVQLDMLAGLVAARLGDRAGPTPATWLDARGAAAYLACGVGRIHDLVALAKLTPRRDGRRLLFRRDDLDAYLEGTA
jgi:excisionase family DNA binding protein